ncbi:hypothetical protein [Pantoea agglomerans]|jgi:hypothetical protein|uniref:hypothetical protein n=1 Tax=Enterobacter agglomerans TaxID=549 RepID=UPI0021D7CB57|nr:hypothetical protein [Pantoea agglomerans]
MKKYPYGLTLRAVCEAIDAYRDHEDDVPEAGIIAAFEILLAAMDKPETALTAQPVNHPHEWVHIRFTDRSKSQRMKCQIAWSDSLNSVIYDEEGAPLLIGNSGYEVQPS